MLKIIGDKIDLGRYSIEPYWEHGMGLIRWAIHDTEYNNDDREIENTNTLQDAIEWVNQTIIGELMKYDSLVKRTQGSLMKMTAHFEINCPTCGKIHTDCRCAKIMPLPNKQTTYPSTKNPFTIGDAINECNKEDIEDDGDNWDIESDIDEICGDMVDDDEEEELDFIDEVSQELGIKYDPSKNLEIFKKTLRQFGIEDAKTLEEEVGDRRAASTIYKQITGKKSTAHKTRLQICKDIMNVVEATTEDLNFIDSINEQLEGDNGPSTNLEIFKRICEDFDVTDVHDLVREFNSSVKAERVCCLITGKTLRNKRTLLTICRQIIKLVKNDGDI